MNVEKTADLYVIKLDNGSDVILNKSEATQLAIKLGAVIGTKIDFSVEVAKAFLRFVDDTPISDDSAGDFVRFVGWLSNYYRREL